MKAKTMRRTREIVGRAQSTIMVLAVSKLLIFTENPKHGLVKLAQNALFHKHNRKESPSKIS